MSAIHIRHQFSHVRGMFQLESEERLGSKTQHWHGQAGMMLVRARGSYTLPPAVWSAVTTVLGLHGLPPLPLAARRPAAESTPTPPVSVTPAVIYEVYGVKEPKVSRSSNNRQAVAEFQVARPPTSAALAPPARVALRAARSLSLQHSGVCWPLQRAPTANTTANC